MEKMINEEATFVIEGVCLVNSYVSEYPAQMGGAGLLWPLIF